MYFFRHFAQTAYGDLLVWPAHPDDAYAQRFGSQSSSSVGLYNLVVSLFQWRNIIP